jgi:hypothetical protein
MFFAVQIPVSDARRFLGAGFQRLEKPSWANPEAKEFIRGFGPMRVRLRGGVSGLDFENNYCSAKNTLRFSRSLSLQPLKSKTAVISPLCVFRRFFSDGMNVGRFEVGFRGRNPVRDLGGEDCTILLKAVLGLKASVTGASGQASPELGNCGLGMADCYARSTTNEKDAMSQWVGAGRPLMLAEFTVAELKQTSRFSFPVRRFKDAGFTLFRDQFIYSDDVLVGVWILQFDDESTINLPASRDLRVCLFRLHAERECLKHILQLVANKEKRTALAISGDAFREYLEHAAGLLVRRFYCGIEQSDILEAAQDFDSLLNPGERETIFRELRGIDVGREVIASLERLARPAKYNITNIVQAGGKQEVGTMSGDSYKQEQGFQGPNMDVHDNVVTFNKAGQNINLQQLAGELDQLRQELKKRATTPDQDAAVGDVAAAQKAAENGDRATVMQRLKSAGKWVLDVAKDIGVKVAVEAGKAALGL